MRAFIIRPFGTKNEINFDEVERVLIAPALKAVGAEGGTTIDIVESGNIRTDMFRRLLTADLVVADLSIHNANVFYELGIRHALRAHGTFMLRCDADTFPFDLQTDRYFVYSKENPGASLADLITSLQRTKEASEKNAATKDSPVFTSLPNLSEPDPSLFNPVPQDFGEEVTRAAANDRPGDLALLVLRGEGLRVGGAGLAHGWDCPVRPRRVGGRKGHLGDTSANSSPTTWRRTSGSARSTSGSATSCVRRRRSTAPSQTRPSSRTSAPRPTHCWRATSRRAGAASGKASRRRSAPPRPCARRTCKTRSRTTSAPSTKTSTTTIRG